MTTTVHTTVIMRCIVYLYLLQKNWRSSWNNWVIHTTTAGKLYAYIFLFILCNHYCTVMKIYSMYKMRTLNGMKLLHSSCCRWSVTNFLPGKNLLNCLPSHSVSPRLSDIVCAFECTAPTKPHRNNWRYSLVTLVLRSDHIQISAS